MDRLLLLENDKVGLNTHCNLLFSCNDEPVFPIEPFLAINWTPEPVMIFAWNIKAVKMHLVCLRAYLSDGSRSNVLTAFITHTIVFKRQTYCSLENKCSLAYFDDSLSSHPFPLGAYCLSLSFGTCCCTFLFLLDTSSSFIIVLCTEDHHSKEHLISGFLHIWLPSSGFYSLKQH